jgi:chromosome segregation ATPase
MLPDEQEVQDLKLGIGLLKKDVEQTDELCHKLSDSLTKLQEINVNLMQMITLHEQRHEQHEKSEQELKEDIKELHSRITTINREIHERIDQVEKHITDRLDAIRSDLARHKQQDKKTIINELSEVEKWKWMILGGVLVGGFILGKIDITTLLSHIN